MSRAGLLLAAVVAATALTAPAAQAEPHTAQPPSGSSFTPVTPTRVLDTRANGGHAIAANSRVSVNFSTGLVPADATAVVFNLTGTATSWDTFISVGSLSGFSPGDTSNLNLAGGETRANLVTSPIGAGNDHGVRLYTGPGGADAIVDLAGYYAPSTGSRFTSLPPQRVLDTRDSAPVGPDGSVTLDLSSKVPAGATAAVFNLTGTDVTGPTFVTAYPAGQAKPDASNLNLVTGQTSPNLVTVQLSADRKVTLANAHSSVDLIADLAGYYSPDSTQSFFPLQQIRVVDTRNTDGSPRVPLGPGGVHTLDFGGWLPAGATAAVYNLTATNVSGSTYLTAWPQGADRPSASNLNLEPGQTSANMAITAVSPDGKADLFNHVGQTDAIADLAGYFAPAVPACTTGCLYLFGPNNNGRLANGTTDDAVHTPAAAYGLSDVVAASVGGDNGYALRTDGTVWTWGINTENELANGRPYGWADGPLRNVRFSATPGQVLGLTGVKQVVPGFALKTDGTVWAWGSNYMWDLGNGVEDEDYVPATPVQVKDLTGVVAIAGGLGNGYALKSDGTVWSWGRNTDGGLGDGLLPAQNDCTEGESESPKGVNCASATPVQVAGLTGVTKIGKRLAVKADGTVWQWGGTDAGNNPVATPQQVPDLTGVVAVAGTSGFAGTGYALMPDGTVRAWGSNYHDMLGDGVACPFDCPPVPNPVVVKDLTNVTTLASGDSAGYAMKSDGTVWAWGGGQDGALGDGQQFTMSAAPVRITALSGVTALGDGGVAVANP